MEVADRTKALITQYRRWYDTLQPQRAERVVEVDEVALRVAAFYEKIRGVVDWREEHLLRKTAIGRILRRRLFLAPSGRLVAEGLVQDLIRGGHFPNGQVKESRVSEVQGAIDKYLYILNNAPERPPAAFGPTDGRTLEDWLLGMAASEIEEILAPPLRERALIDYMAAELSERIRLDTPEKDLLVSAASSRALFKLDTPTVTEHLLERLEPDWKGLSGEGLGEVSREIHRIRRRTNDILHHEYAERVYRVAERLDTPYLLLGDILSQDPQTFEQTAQDPQTLERAVREAYEARLARLKKRGQRAAVYSTVSIFLTKVLFALAIEIPVDNAFFGGVSMQALGIGVVVPPLLMLLLVATTKTTSPANLERAVMEVMGLVYKKTKGDELELPRTRRSGGLWKSVVSAFYGLTFLLTFGALVWGLLLLELSPASIAIFLLFLSLVAFAGTIIRQRAKELLVVPEREGFWHGLGDVFFLPVIRVGRWLSGQLVRYNVLVVFFNFIVDVPFQLFVEFLEQWRAFLREKKEEIH